MSKVMGSIQTISSNELLQAQTHLYKHLYSFLNCMVLKCAVQLSIPDIIHNHGQPITIPQLISNLQVHPTKSACVKRLVRFLVHNGFLSETKENEEDEEEQSYTLTPSSKLLVTGMEPCLAPMVLGIVDMGLISPFDFWARWFKGEEETISESAFGVGFWDMLGRDLQTMKSFNEGMASDSQMINVALRDCKSVFEGLESVVDVGGGTGTTCRIISEAYPSLKCIVFDLPQVVENFSGSNNLSYVGGNMLESIPSADAVLLKWVLHNWDDESSIKILIKCKDAISKKGKDGKVIIIDAVMKEKEDEGEMMEVKLLFDMLMMGINGKERNEKEWENLLLAAGFKHHRITPFLGFRSVIEAYPHNNPLV